MLYVVLFTKPQQTGIFAFYILSRKFLIVVRDLVASSQIDADSFKFNNQNCPALNSYTYSSQLPARVDF